jgi:hypothetical protein
MRGIKLRNIALLTTVLYKGGAGEIILRQKNIV